MQGAAELLNEAKGVHDELEKFYIGAMDFDRVNVMAAKVLGEMSRLPNVQ